jgi:arylsulfatase A-like enzyme
MLLVALASLDPNKPEENTSLNHPKNILFLVVDSLRMDSVMGKRKTAHTAIFDRLRSQGVFCRNHHSVSSFTTPSVGSMLTGLYPFRHKLHFQSDKELAAGVVPLGVFFKQKGYRTVATVTEVLTEQHELLAGFDEVIRRPSDEGIHQGWGADTAQRVRTYESSRDPWIFVVHAFELHPLRRCAPEYRNRRLGANYYDQTLSSLDAHLEPILAEVNFEKTVVVVISDHGENILFEPSSSEQFANIAHGMRTDERLEKLREALFERGIASQSKFWLRNNPLFHHDYHLYRFLTHVPLVIVDAGVIPPGGECAALTSHIDLMPTLVDLAGLDTALPDDLDGKSLTKILSGTEASERERFLYQELYTAFINLSRPVEQILREPLFEGILTHKWHLITSPAHPNHAELYQIDNDPEERRNLASRNPDVVQKLRTNMHALANSAPLRATSTSLRSPI